MFKEIGLAIRALFAGLTVLFGAFSKGASAIDHLASWADETAGAFSDEARAERQAKAVEVAKAAAALEAKTVDMPKLTTSAKKA